MMGFPAWIFKIILIFILSSSFATAEIEDPGDQEYQIYSTVIQDILLNETPGSMNISDHTEFPDFLDNLLYYNPPFSKGLARLENGTLKSFSDCNSRHYPLQRRFNLSIEYVLVNEKNELYATWIAGFSRVGFSTNGDQALLLLDRAAYWHISEGTFVLLEKADGIWRVKASELAYIGE
jgi:hypothetical protein